MFTLVGEAAKFSKALLDTSDVFILDTTQQVFAWVRKGANRSESRAALGFAQRYLTGTNKPAYLPIERLSEGNENAAFATFFLDLIV